MSATIPLEEAQVKLKELIHQLTPGDELIITEDQQPVAKLVSETGKVRPPRKAGNCTGMIKIVADDDEHLQDFEDYM